MIYEVTIRIGKRVIKELAYGVGASGEDDPGEAIDFIRTRYFLQHPHARYSAKPWVRIP